MDRAALLDRVGGDEDLLREITGIFVSECPQLMDEIRSALAEHDARRLERSAHSLKGAVSNFAAGDAVQAAYRLERLARQSQLDDAAAALISLEKHVAQLCPALLHILDEGAEGS